MDNEACAKKWAQRFRNIITQYMICTKDVMKKISEICDVSIYGHKKKQILIILKWGGVVVEIK